MKKIKTPAYRVEFQCIGRYYTPQEWVGPATDERLAEYVETIDSEIRSAQIIRQANHEIVASYNAFALTSPFTAAW